MKTGDLIDALTADDAPVRTRPLARELVLAALVGAAVAAIFVVFGLGLRPLDAAARSGMFWVKGLYTLALAMAGGMATARFARPGGAAGRTSLLAAGAVAAMVAIGAVDLVRVSGGVNAMAREWLGESWRVCPWYILALAAPVYVAIIRVMRRMAPTRLRLAGAAAGLFAGGVAATVYGLHCPESAAAFVATWYTLGIVAAALAGGLFGPRLLRW